jgi:hypothetical protein
LKDDRVLLVAVQQGTGQLTWNDFFAYASGWDEARQRYLGLTAGQSGQSITLDGQSMLVKPDPALRQMDHDQVEQRRKSEAQQRKTEKLDGQKGEEPAEKVPDFSDTPPEKKQRRFYGTVELDSLRASRDVGKIVENVIQHLTSLPHAEITIALEIHADLPDGAPDDVIRTVTENASTLKFRDFGFEEG